MECGFAGNADIYGVGIRIGYYTQALAVWFADCFHHRESQVLRSVNKLFMFALVVAAGVYAANAPAGYVIEAFLLLQIGLAIGVVGIMESTRYSTRYTRRCRVRLISRALIVNASLIFNILFWWRGLDVMRSTPCFAKGQPQDTNAMSIKMEQRETYVCYFSKVSIYGWYRTLMLVKSLCALAWTTWTRSSHDAAELLQQWRIGKDIEAFVAAATAYQETLEGSTSIGGNPKLDAGAEAGGTAVEDSNLKPIDSKRELVDSQSNPQPSSIEGINRPPTLEANKKNDKPEEAENLPSTTGNALNTFVAVREAEEVLNSIFSIYTKPHASPNNKRYFQLFGGRVKFSMKRILRVEKQHQYSHFECWWTGMRGLWTNKPSRSHRWLLALHMAELRQHTPMYFPRLLHHMYKVNEASGLPRWQTMAIASEVQLRQIPLEISPMVSTLMAIERLAIVMAVIVHVELTIAWNNISGLQSLTTLGQLIPFVLGVGGLLKVLWGKWRLVQSGVGESPERDSRPVGHYEAAMALYIQWKVSEQSSPNPAGHPRVPNIESMKAN